MSIRKHQATVTRGRLLEEARRIFLKKGFESCSLEDIVSQASLTKGAFYHHFSSKLAVFDAVVEDLEQKLADEVRRSGEKEKDPWERLLRMVWTYLERCRSGNWTRLLIIEGPAILGWRRWCEISNRHEMAVFIPAVQQAVQQGRKNSPSAETVSRILLGALNTAARILATNSSAQTFDESRETISRLLAGFR